MSPSGRSFRDAGGRGRPAVGVVRGAGVAGPPPERVKPGRPVRPLRSSIAWSLAPSAPGRRDEFYLAVAVTEIRAVSESRRAAR